MNETVLLTGATGFLGSHLLEALIKSDYKVVVLKRSTSNLWRIKHLFDRFVAYDIDIVPIANAFKEQRVNTVIHTACNYGRNNESSSAVAETNLLFSLKLLETSLNYNTNTFFNTDTLLPKHLNKYSLSKKQFVEWFCFVSGSMKVINMKLEHMYGSGDDQTKFVPLLISQLAAGVPEIKLTSGDQKRDFIHVEDVVAAYLTVIRKVKELVNYNEFEVGTGEQTTVKQFVQMLKKCYDAKFGATSTFLNFGALPYRDGEMMEVKVDNTALTRLSWRPSQSVLSGLTEIMENIK